MTRLSHEISILAPIEKIWTALAEVENLEKFDPTVKSSVALSTSKSGQGSRRKVNMKDGKNWFEETITVSHPNEALTYELTACTFPIHQLRHSYTFEQSGPVTRVKQVMEYRVKFGLLGKIMDLLMIRKQTSKGIRQFMAGLKQYGEGN
jgi:ribosome-associated toxin RatA of RatAB toxin-antitoxin module